MAHWGGGCRAKNKQTNLVLSKLQIDLEVTLIYLKADCPYGRWRTQEVTNDNCQIKQRPCVSNFRTWLQYSGPNVHTFIKAHNITVFSFLGPVSTIHVTNGSVNYCYSRLAHDAVLCGYVLTFRGRLLPP